MTTPPSAARRARSEARKARRAEKRIETAQLAVLGGVAGPQTAQGGAERSNRRTIAPKSLKSKPTRKRGKKVPARKRAFLRLKAACKAFVFGRNAALNDGMCEIAIPCGGANTANTWYHGWPQKGGNGLKYDVRSHFASCGDCNIGEYGARYRGSKVYENRHRELLGAALFDELAALHGRRPIKTYEAREMADALEARTAAGAWS